MVIFSGVLGVGECAARAQILSVQELWSNYLQTTVLMGAASVSKSISCRVTLKTNEGHEDPLLETGMHAAHVRL